MKRAQRRNAVMNQKFLFRKCSPICGKSCDTTDNSSSDDIVEMSINEIINGFLFLFPTRFNDHLGQIKIKWLAVVLISMLRLCSGQE